MGKKSELTNLVDNLYIISRILRNAEKRPRHYGTKMLLYPNEAYTLKAIVECEGITQKQLTSQMYRTKGATSAVVQKLLQKGLIVSRTESADLRVGNLYPTETGKDVYRAHREYDRRYVDMIASEGNLTAEDIAKVNQILKYIIDRNRLSIQEREKEFD